LRGLFFREIPNDPILQRVSQICAFLQEKIGDREILISRARARVEWVERLGGRRRSGLALDPLHQPCNVVARALLADCKIQWTRKQ
jgi:hypothetical protein